jgi:hypothetical protein
VEIWNDFTQEREPFACKLGPLERQAGDIAAWPCQIRDEAGADWVIGYRKDSRNTRCCLLCFE